MNIADVICSACETGKRGTTNCEKCQIPSSHLVKACIRLPLPNLIKIYKGETAYQEWCSNCMSETAAWQTMGGECSDCINRASSIRIGSVCPDCADDSQHYCCECDVPVETLLPSLKCVSCDAVSDFQEQASTGSSIRLSKCKSCNSSRVLDSNGWCRDCFRKKKLDLFYKSHAYMVKCKTCGNPAEKGVYCKNCSIRYADCVECEAAIRKPAMTCHDHRYTCTACGDKYDPDGYDSLTCDKCKAYTKEHKECPKCHSIVEEGLFMGSGLCNDCYEDVMEEIVCRRCEKTKGYTVCPECWNQSYLCARCKEVKVHAIEFVCTTCKLPY